MAKDPAFPWYASDWLGSNRRAMMSLEEQGAYMNLLCRQWTDKTCSLPDDDETLARVSELNEGWFKGSSTTLRLCFPKHPTLEGRIGNTKLLKLRAERDEWIQKSREGGRKSAAAKKKRRGNGGSTTVPTKRQPIANSPSPSPSLLSPLNPPKGKSGFDPLKVMLPLNLDTPVFQTAWADWAQHRKEKNQKLTPTSVGRQLKKLAAMGLEQAIATIEHTIEKSWTGLREPDDGSSRGAIDPRKLLGENDDQE